MSLPAKYRVLYDGQCEVCQASVAWLQLLDRGRRTDPIPIDASTLASVSPRLALEDCLREIHVVAPDGEILTGWQGLARLARLFPATWLVGAIGSVPPLSWLASAFYRFVARNRYAFSKCRGGACRVFRPEPARRRSPLAAFWSCYTLGMLLRLPLALGFAALSVFRNVRDYARTFRRRAEFLDGKLSLLFLGGLRCDPIPIVFGERFAAVLYKGLLLDPGSPPMRRSLLRHLDRLPPGSVREVAITHHHEEHSGNLAWIARRLGRRVHAGSATANLLRTPAILPFVRRCLISASRPLEPPVEVLGTHIEVAGGRLDVLAAPGHCDDHVVFYDPEEKVLLAGDAFMGAYFSTPNPDVDSRLWLDSLDRLLALDIEILVEGHGHIHTLREDVPDAPGIVIRRDPRDEIRDKVGYLRWLREQVESGFGDGLPLRAVEASCFPWGRRRSWESFASDELTRLLSLGHFSRTELVRSFVRKPQSRDVLPTVYETRLYTDDSTRRAIG